ncbi:MAG: rRNA maturation RNase YbeY [Bacteroidetes bacterium]|nr:MAG: rRNA maturation RNase YbeY [Bacteroidota bacterium]
MAVYFFTEDISFTLDKEDQTAAWVEQILKQEGYKAENISYVFCSDNHLLELNQQYLNHDTLTDIITFDHSEEKENLEADIFISIDRVKENAATLEKEFTDELHRVIIHGLLHLIGLKDKTKAEKQEMRKKEDACLSLR